MIDVKGDLACAVTARARDFDQVIYMATHATMRHGHYWSFNPHAFKRADPVRFEFYANVRSTTQRCRPSFSLASVPLRAMRTLMRRRVRNRRQRGMS